MQEAANELIEMLLDVGEDQIASKGYLFFFTSSVTFQTLNVHAVIFVLNCMSSELHVACYTHCLYFYENSTL